MEGQEFILAGYGSHAWWNFNKDTFDTSRLNRKPVFHKGVNTIEYIRNNLIYYEMNKLDDGGLVNEVAGSFGDSGSGAILEKDGELYIIGVLSHGNYSKDLDGVLYQKWGSPYYGAYTSTSGRAFEWVKENMQSLDENIDARNCRLWSRSSRRGRPLRRNNDYYSYFEGFEDESFDCSCDCKEGAIDCWQKCDICLGNALTFESSQPNTTQE